MYEGWEWEFPRKAKFGRKTSFPRLSSYLTGEGEVASRSVPEKFSGFPGPGLICSKWANKEATFGEHRLSPLGTLTCRERRALQAQAEYRWASASDQGLEGADEWRCLWRRETCSVQHLGALELRGFGRVPHSGFLAGADHNRFQTHTPEFAPSDNSRFPLQAATILLVSSTEKAQHHPCYKGEMFAEFHPLSQSRYWRINLDLRGNKLISSTYE